MTSPVVGEISAAVGALSEIIPRLGREHRPPGWGGGLKRIDIRVGKVSKRLNMRPKMEAFLYLFPHSRLPAICVKSRRGCIGLKRRIALFFFFCSRGCTFRRKTTSSNRPSFTSQGGKKLKRKLHLKFFSPLMPNDLTFED